MGVVVLGQLSSEFGFVVPVTIPPTGYKINIYSSSSSSVDQFRISVSRDCQISDCVKRK
jgi:hypothetical protein